jgi:pyroglutamyl-peptidase
MDGGVRKVLVTGFAPLGGGRADPSSAVARRLQGWRAHGGVVQALELPCAFEAAHAALVQALRCEQPDVVWLLGPATALHGLSVEAVPINLHGDLPGVAPRAQPAALPVQAIVRALGDAGVPAREARNAGCLLSIRLFFTLAHHIANEAPALRAGLMHLPSLTTDAQAGPRPGLSIKTMANALRIAVETALAPEAPLPPWIGAAAWCDTQRSPLGALEEFG